MSKHTPTPWNVDKRFKTLVIGDGHSVATCGGYQNNTIDPDELAEMLEANARHIVKCVNNHDRLVEALRNLLSRVENDADSKSWFLSEQESARDLLAELERQS